MAELLSSRLDKIEKKLDIVIAWIDKCGNCVPCWHDANGPVSQARAGEVVWMPENEDYEIPLSEDIQGRRH